MFRPTLTHGNFMQVTETTTDGLKREYKVVITAETDHFSRRIRTETTTVTTRSDSRGS